MACVLAQLRMLLLVPRTLPIPSRSPLSLICQRRYLTIDQQTIVEYHPTTNIVPPFRAAPGLNLQRYVVTIFCQPNEVCAWQR